MVSWRKHGPDTVASIVDVRGLSGFRKSASAGPFESVVVLKNGVIKDAVTEGRIRTRSVLDAVRSLAGIAPDVQVL